MNDKIQQPPDPPVPDGRRVWQAGGKIPFPTAEYVAAELSALREEIMRLKDVEFQLMSLNLVVAGAFLSLAGGFLSLGVQLELAVDPLILLFFPIISVFLAIQFADRRRGELTFAEYLIERFEVNLPPGVGWETFLFTKRFGTRQMRRQLQSLSGPARYGVFLIPQLLAGVFAVSRSTHLMDLFSTISHGVFPPPAQYPQVILLAIDIVSIVVTAIVLRDTTGPTLSKLKVIVDQRNKDAATSNES